MQIKVCESKLNVHTILINSELIQTTANILMATLNVSFLLAQIISVVTRIKPLILNTSTRL